jgi:hypothetical protein
MVYRVVMTLPLTSSIFPISGDGICSNSANVMSCIVLRSGMRHGNHRAGGRLQGLVHGIHPAFLHLELLRSVAPVARPVRPDSRLCRAYVAGCAPEGVLPSRREA